MDRKMDILYTHTHTQVCKHRQLTTPENLHATDYTAFSYTYSEENSEFYLK